MKYLLDTSTILFFLINNEKYLLYKNQFQFTDWNVFVSSVSKGELYSIAICRKWGTKKIKMLADFLRQVHFIDIHFYSDEIFDTYAKIDAFSHCIEVEGKVNKKGFTMGKNDLWISASSVVANCELLTCDKDFTQLNNQFLKVHYLPPTE